MQLFFSVTFALRRVVLLRSDIRLSAELYSLRECEGEYNITVPQAQYHFCVSKNITSSTARNIPFLLNFMSVTERTNIYPNRKTAAAKA